MKKGFIIIVLVILAILYVSCEEVRLEPEPDYRNKWLGIYECEEIYHVWHLTERLEDTVSGTVSWLDTSYNIVYQTIINITLYGDSSLSISENKRGESYGAKLNTNDYFFKINNSIGPKFEVEGNFVGDSLYMRINLSRFHASSSFSTYKGKKIK